MCLLVCPEGDAPPPVAPLPPRILPHTAHLVLLRGPGVVGVHVEGVIEMDAVPDPAHTLAIVHTLGHGTVEDEEAAQGDAMRGHALAPQIGTEIEEGTTHRAEEPGKRNWMINGLAGKDKVVLYT